MRAGSTATPCPLTVATIPAAIVAISPFSDDEKDGKNERRRATALLARPSSRTTQPLSKTGHCRCRATRTADSGDPKRLPKQNRRGKPTRGFLNFLTGFANFRSQNKTTKHVSTHPLTLVEGQGLTTGGGRVKECAKNRHQDLRGATHMNDTSRRLHLDTALLQNRNTGGNSRVVVVGQTSSTARPTMTSDHACMPAVNGNIRSASR